eukprot:117605_1
MVEKGVDCDEWPTPAEAYRYFEDLCDKNFGNSESEKSLKSFEVSKIAGRFTETRSSKKSNISREWKLHGHPDPPEVIESLFSANNAKPQRKRFKVGTRRARLRIKCKFSTCEFMWRMTQRTCGCGARSDNRFIPKQFFPTSTITVVSPEADLNGQKIEISEVFLPSDVMNKILNMLDFVAICRLKSVSSNLRKFALFALRTRTEVLLNPNATWTYSTYNGAVDSIGKYCKNVRTLHPKTRILNVYKGNRIFYLLKNCPRLSNLHTHFPCMSTEDLKLRPSEVYVNLTSLSMTVYGHTTHLPDVFPNLERLSLVIASSHLDLSRLVAGLRYLKRLTVYLDCWKSSRIAEMNLPRLKELHLFESDLDDIVCEKLAAQFPKLESVALSGSPTRSGIRTLSSGSMRDHLHDLNIGTLSIAMQRQVVTGIANGTLFPSLRRLRVCLPEYVRTQSSIGFRGGRIVNVEVSNGPHDGGVRFCRFNL